MRSALVLGLLFIHVALLHAQPHHLVDPADLPAWIAGQITGETPKSALKTNAKPVHTNVFVGTWIMRATGGKRLLYWGDEHRMIIQEVQGMDTPVRTLLVDLQANVSMTLYPRQNGYGGRVRDLYHPQQGYFLELWSDSVVATGKRDTLMNELCAEYVGTNANGGSITYWRTTAHTKLFSDLQVWGPWLREGEVKYLSAFNHKRTGPALQVSWDGKQYTPSKGEVTFHRITPGKQPMPKLDLAGAVLAEERLLWVNATQLGRLPPWMRERLNRLPPDSLPLAYTPSAEDRNIPDNKFVGTLTARSASRWTDADGTRDQFGTFTYWADARRAILTVDAPHEKGKTTYMVDLDHDVTIVSRNEGHDHVIPKLEITTLEGAGLVEFGRGVDLPFTPTGTYRKILGRQCQLHTTSEYYFSRYWFSDVTTPNPIHDMARWMMPKPSQVFKDLMFFGVADKPLPFAVMATELTSFKPGKAPPPAIDLSDHWVKDHRLDSHKRSSSYEPPNSGGSYSGGPTNSPAQERRVEVNEEPVQLMLEPTYDGDLMPTDDATGNAGADRPDPKEIATRLLKNRLDRSMNHYRGKARMKFTLINKRDTAEWFVDYAGTNEQMMLVRTPIRPEEMFFAIIIHRMEGTETRYTLDRSTGEVTAGAPEALRTEHPPFYISPLIDYQASGEPIKILGRDCVPQLHTSPLGVRTVWQTQAPASLFLDLCSARKGWEGMNEYIMGELFGLLSYSNGMILKAEWTDGPYKKAMMEVVSLEPGAVDPNLFQITVDSWE